MPARLVSLISSEVHFLIVVGSARRALDGAPPDDASPAYAGWCIAGMSEGVARNRGSAALMLAGAATMSSGAARLAPSQPHYALTGELSAPIDAVL